VPDPLPRIAVGIALGLIIAAAMRRSAKRAD
jgi:hypothetical protein